LESLGLGKLNVWEIFFAKSPMLSREDERIVTHVLSYGQDNPDAAMTLLSLFLDVRAFFFTNPFYSSLGTLVLLKFLDFGFT
jgi:hypothetical protein